MDWRGGEREEEQMGERDERRIEYAGESMGRKQAPLSKLLKKDMWRP